MPSKRFRDMIILLSIIIVCLIAYSRYFSGIMIEYDDAIYGYEISLHNFSYAAQSAFPGSLGFIPYGYPFSLVFGNTLEMASYVGLSSVLITILIIFRIGKLLGSIAVSILGSLFYGLNPLVVSYSTRLVPDTFIAMLLALAILVFYIAWKRESGCLYISSGLIAGLSLFFGLQGFLSILAFFIFSTTALILGKKDRQIKRKNRFYLIMPLAGIIIAFVIFLIPQQLLFGNPLHAIVHSSSFWQELSNNLYNVKYFYFYLIFPFAKVGSLISDTSEPYSNTGILIVVLILASLVVLVQKRRIRLLAPYLVSAIAFISYVTFGTESISAYSKLMNINRLLIPFVLVVSIGLAYAIYLISAKKRLKYTLMVCILAAYLASSFYFYNYSINWYSKVNIYKNLDSIEKNLSIANTGKYALYENYSSILMALCMISNVTPGKCGESIQTPLSASLCNVSHTILIYHGVMLCKGNYVYVNTEDKVYVNLIR